MFKRPGNGRKPGLLIEILMIIVSINIALWFEKSFQDHQDAEIEEHYLDDLREDLITDIQRLSHDIEAGDAKSQQSARYIEQLPKISELSLEEQAQAIFAPASYQFFVPSDFTYRSMQESGDFRLLRNADIKKSILRLDRRHKEIALLQTNYLQALDDGYIPLIMNRFDVATMQVTDPTLLDDQLFRNFFAFARQDTDTTVAMYRLARTQSEELVQLIEEDLGD
jgi:hypothetical protein